MIEERKYTVIREGLKPPSSTWIDLKCPFCGSINRAYLWSLAGSGKRCEYEKCRAKFTSWGGASREKKD